MQSYATQTYLRQNLLAQHNNLGPWDNRKINTTGKSREQEIKAGNSRKSG
jgi:hypothetical protein